MLIVDFSFAYATGFYDSNDPDNPDEPESSSSECETATYSDCSTSCTASPSGCTSTCSSIVGCDTTGTEVASTVTLAPFYAFNDEDWSTLTDDDAQLESAAIPIISWLSSIGDMTGIGTGPISSTATGPSSTTSTSPQPTSSPTSTVPSSTSTSSLTVVPPPSEPTAQLLVAYGSECDEDALSCDSEWLFYEPSVGATNNVCSDDVAHTTAPADISVGDVPYPSGTFSLAFKVNGESGCTYTGTSDGPGILDCPDFTLPQQCEEDSQDTDVLNCYFDQGVLQVVPKVYCAWD